MWDLDDGIAGVVLFKKSTYIPVPPVAVEDEITDDDSYDRWRWCRMG